MKRKALLSIILSAALILGSVSPAFAAGEMPSDEVAVSSESQDEVMIEDDSTVDSEEESVDDQEADEEVGTESESEDADIEKETPNEESKPVTDSAEEEDEQPETLVGAEGERVSVGDNVTAGFNCETGTLTFYSQGGTLSRDWLNRLGVREELIINITISDDSDVMYLPEDCSHLFFCENLESLDLSKANTSNVTNMSSMFNDGSHQWLNLRYLDISGFDTSNVTDMSYMFAGVSYVSTLDLSSFDASNVTNMSGMFVTYFASSIDVILTPVNVNVVAELPGEFYEPYTYFDASGVGYSSLPQGLSESIRLTRKCPNISDEPENITDATVTGIVDKPYTGAPQTQNPTVKLGDKTLIAGTDYMLSYANNTSVGTATVSITGICNYTGTISRTFTINAAEEEPVSVGDNVTAGFDRQTGTLTFYSQGGTLFRDWFDRLGVREDFIFNITISDDSDVMYLPEDSSGLFSSLWRLQSMNLSKADTSNVTDMSSMFTACSSLQALDLSGFDTSNVTDMSDMFSGNNGDTGWSSLQALDVSEFDTSSVTDMSHMFGRCCQLQALDVSGFDTSNVTDMSGMFADCNSLQALDVSGFDTSNVTDMSFMFGGCNRLQVLDVSGFDTSNITSMSGMFACCSSLQVLDISGFVTTGVTDMSEMFELCSSLQNLDVNAFDTSNVTNMSNMFCDCSSLNTLDLSGFDTSNVLTMYCMFTYCSNLEELNVSNFDTSNVGVMDFMFEGCNSLQRLDLSSFDMEGIISASSMLDMWNEFELLVILSPINVHKLIHLPYTFVDTSGTEYDSLPQGLSESIRLTKKGADIPDDPKNIADATITGITNKTYTGTAQTQNPTVKLGDMTLTAGTDYTLSYANNTNAGTATVKITGMGNYTGTISKTFTINQAVPALTFASTSITKTTQDAEFTNALTKITDGSVTFASNNSSVAAVNSTSGKVTIKGAGTTTISVTATEGTNYKAGSAVYTLTVTNGLEIVSISDDFYGKTGTPASFHIEAEGSGTVTYQWQYRTAGTTGWKTPSIASAKTADYTFNLKPSYDNIEVRCIVSDDSGNEMISETRKANVFAYTSQPKDATAAEGQDVNFEVSAIGHNVKYQWYFKRPDSTWKKATKAGSTTAVFPITAGTINNGTSYRCVITDEAGNKITSAAGLLTVYKSLKVTSISDDYYGKNGTQASFHIEAEGNGAVSYQWQYRTAGTTSWRTPSQASAKTADYVFKLKPSYDNIEVRCIVSDDSGNSITSDVRKANVFAITGQPEDAELELGEQTTFSVEAAGKDLAYQWFYMRPEGSWKKVTVAGANTANLVITANTKNDGTKFRCRVTDGLGNVLVSSAALLTQP